MPQPTNPPLTASAIVSNILTGRTADGTNPLAYTIPFTSDPDARLAISRYLHFLRLGIDDAHITPLAAKLLSHLNKTGCQTAKTIAHYMVANMPALHAAIQHNPDLLLTNAGIPAIIRAHRNHILQAAACRRRDIPRTIPPRTVLWECLPYRFEEATDPRHLEQDSTTLGHCVGTLHHTQALDHHHLKEYDPDAIHYLHYWLAIKHRRARIFTFTRHHEPLVTLHQCTATGAILQMRGLDDIKGTEQFFRPLCQAISAIRHTLPITSLPPLPFEHQESTVILCADGTLRKPTLSNIPSALKGDLHLKKGHAAWNAAACANSMLDIVLSDIGPYDTDLITDVAGSLFLIGPFAYLPNLRSVGGSLDLYITECCNLPQLQTIGGDLSGLCLNEAFMPRLHTVGGEFDTPALQTADLRSLVSVAQCAHYAERIRGFSTPATAPTV